MGRLYGVLEVSKEVISKMVDGSKKKKTFGCILIFFCNNGRTRDFLTGDDD